MTTEQEWTALKEAAEQCPAGSLVMGRPSTILALEAEHRRLRAENERLREANGILEDALQEVGDDYPGSSCQEWCQQQVNRARAALAQEGE